MICKDENLKELLNAERRTVSELKGEVIAEPTTLQSGFQLCTVFVMKELELEAHTWSCCGTIEAINP